MKINSVKYFSCIYLTVDSFYFYVALHETLSDDLSTGLADHSLQRCIVCTPEAYSEDEVSRLPWVRRGALSALWARNVNKGMLTGVRIFNPCNIK